MTLPHSELKAMAAGYTLGSLDADEREVFLQHLGECADCDAEVRSLAAALEVLAGSVPQHVPPSDLRARVLSSVRGAPSSPHSHVPHPKNPWTDRRVWLPAAASLVVALGAGIYGSHLHVETRLAALSERADLTDREIAAARRAALDVRSAIDVMAAPDVTRIDLKGEGTFESATARVLWSRDHGMVFASTNLPSPPAGMAHHVWLLAGGRTVHTGAVPSAGLGVAIFSTPGGIPPPVGAAVTVEPAGTTPAAPSKPPILAGTREPLDESR